MIKCKKDDDFQKKLDQANRDFLYYIFQTISIVLKYPDAVHILNKVAESCYSGSLELENKIIFSKKMRLAKDSPPPIATILLKSVRALRNYIIYINDQKINFVNPEYYPAILESYCNISVCVAAMHMIFNGKVRASNNNADKLVKICGNYIGRSKGYLDTITKRNRSADIYYSRVVDDIDNRRKIARTIGLESIPQFDPNAIFRLDGIIGKQLQSKGKLDSVEVVKSIREC